MLTSEQIDEINVVWTGLCKQQLEPLVGTKLTQSLYSALECMARSIGRELTHQFQFFLRLDEQIEVTLGIDENLGLVGGWRVTEIPPPLTSSKVVGFESLL